jgi:hypothetical protein
VVASKACNTAGDEFSTAHTIPFVVPLALTAGVIPGYANVFAVFTLALVASFAFVIGNAFRLSLTAP